LSCQWQRSEVCIPIRRISLSQPSVQELIKNASPNGNEMLLNGKAPSPGQIVQLPNLAKTFREVVAKGRDGFYKGRVAQAIVNLIQSKGGVMELEDLANHKSTVVEPIKYTYANEVTVYEVRRFHPDLSTIFNSASAPQMDKASLSRFDVFFFFSNLACIRYYCSPCLGYPGEYPRARSITPSVGDGT